MPEAEVSARMAGAYPEELANERRKQELEKLLRSHVCLCGEALSLSRQRVDAGPWPWTLKCRVCGWRAEEQIKRRKSLTKLFKEGVALPLSIADKIERKVGGKPMDSKALMATTEQGMLARIERAKFPQDLTPSEKSRLALGAITYGLDPLMGELTIYQGNLYVGIDGRRRKAQETGKCDGIHTRPATKQEKEEWGYDAKDYFFHADIFVKGASHPFEGWGRVSRREIDRLIDRANAHKKDPYSIPAVKDPQGMAEKRAEAKGLRKAFNIPLPSAEAIGEEDDSDLPEEPAVVITQPACDQITGEIIDATVREVDADDILAENDAQNAASASQPPEVPNPPSEPPKATPAQSSATAGPEPATPERIKPSQYDRMRTLAGENWKLLLADISKKHHVAAMDMSADLADQYIRALEAKAK